MSPDSQLGLWTCLPNTNSDYKDCGFGRTDREQGDNPNILFLLSTYLLPWMHFNHNQLGN